MDRNFEIADLIARKITGTLSPQQLAELDSWVAENPDHQAFIDRISSTDQLLSKLEIYQLFDQTENWKKLESDLFPRTETRIVPMRWLRYAAAILLPVAIGFATYYVLDTPKDQLAQIDAIIQPGDQRATLILADGTSMDLTTPKSQPIVQGTSKIIHTDQSLSYSSSEETEPADEEPVLFNELITPRGGAYTLKLADGTRVTLNAESRLKYPVEFRDSVREVYLEGEGFFEVTHTGQSFAVNSKSLNVVVLGTTFNLSAYGNDPTASGTLVEGSVRLVADNENRILKPGEQGVFFTENSNLIVNQVNTDLYTSWVKGLVEFENEDLQSVMTRLSRWYDFEYEFENEQARTYHFSARLDNKQKISSILEMLSLTTNVRFRLEEKTIIIY